MSQQKYFALVTDKGLAKLRAAAQGLGPLMLSHMAFGDGNGQETAPSGTAIALVNERYRALVADKKPHPTNPSMLYVEAIIPPGVGGWTLREAGIYDTDGDLICIAKTPVMDVALLAEGATTEGLVKLTLTFDSIQSVQFFIDPTVLLATQAWVIDRIIHRPFITVESVTLNAPPASPTDHALYVVPTAGATGAWAGKANQMAYWHGAWQFAQAPVAKVVGASDTGKYYKRTAAGWTEFLGDETTPGFLRLATDAEHKPGARRDLATHPAGVAAQVQMGSWNTATAGGAANALTAAFTPAVTTHTIGAIYYVKALYDNTSGTVSFDPSTGMGAGAKSITGIGGRALQAGSIKAGMICQLAFDGTRYQLLNENVIPASMLTESGYVKLPGGLMIQWGRSTFPVSNTTVTWSTVYFPISFPNMCFSATAIGTSPIAVDGWVAIVWCSGMSPSLANFSIDTNGTKIINRPPTFNWMAIGY